MRTRPLILLATLGAAAAVSSAACSGDGGGGGGGGDETPTPTPVFDADRCQIVWENDVTTAVKDLYVVDAPVEAWVLSTNHQYALTTSGFVAAFFEALDLSTGDYVSSVQVSSGTFSLSLSGTNAFTALGFDDEDPQPLYTLDSNGNPAAFAGTGGSGSYNGLWSDPYSQNVSPGNGAITVVVDGTAHTLGVDLSYAICYTGSGALFRPPFPRRLR